MAKELVVFDTKKHPLLVGTGDVTEVLQSNLGGEEISPNDLAMVKMPTGGGVHWAVPTAEGEESVPTITGVIVHIARTRAWWRSNETTGDPPDCSSVDGLNGHGKPGGLCMGCPNNEWGTAVNDAGNPTKGKACGEKKLLFVIREGQILPTVVRVSTASLCVIKKWQLGITSIGVRPTCAI